MIIIASWRLVHMMPLCNLCVFQPVGKLNTTRYLR